jgi:hypothetical protein
MASIEGHAGKAMAALAAAAKCWKPPAPRERLTLMADHYTAMAPEQRAKTLVIEPSREGRDRLTGLIRENLAAKGELSSSGLTLKALWPRA